MTKKQIIELATKVIKKNTCNEIIFSCINCSFKKYCRLGHKINYYQSSVQAAKQYLKKNVI